MTLNTLLCALALSLPMAASAELYRCTQADGTARFQDRPCSGSSGKAQAGSRADSGDSHRITLYQHQKDSSATAEPEPTEDAVSAANRKIEAHNQTVRCNQARHSLGVLSEQRPVYRYDDKGERQYLDDSTRERELAAARQSVSKYCK